MITPITFDKLAADEEQPGSRLFWRRLGWADIKANPEAASDPERLYNLSRVPQLEALTATELAVAYLTLTQLNTLITDAQIEGLPNMRSVYWMAGFKLGLPFLTELDRLAPIFRVK